MDFDYSCNRGHAFSESYIHGVINEILCANIDPGKGQVISGYPHPAIQKGTLKAGRSREVDFYVKPRNSGVTTEACIEVKWAGSSHCNGASIIADLCRLTLVAQQGDAECYFVLAGRDEDITKVMASPALASNAGTRKDRVLKMPSPGRAPKKAKKRLADYSGGGLAVAKAIQELPRVPDHINSQVVQPVRHGSERWNVLVWNILGQ